MSTLLKRFNKLTDKQKTLVALGLFALLILLFYGNTLGNGFVADDTGQIERNEYLGSLKYLPKAFTSCIWESANSGCSGHTFFYRPVHFASAILTYQITSAPWFFHFMNLLYLLTIASLIFILGKLLIKSPLISFLAALLFIIHPINTEVINFVSAAPELFMTIFVLLTTIFYIRYRQKESPGKLALVYLFYTLGILSKEPAILVPVILVVLDIFFFKLSIRELIRWNQLVRYLFFGVPFIIYYFARNAVLGVPGQYGGLGIAERLHAVITLFVQYISKLFYPYPLVLYHSFEQSGDLLSLVFFVSLAVVVLFFAALFLFIKERMSFFVFLLAWFAVFISPVLIFLGGVGENAFSERYVFMPGIAFSFFIAMALAYGLKRSKMIQIATLGIIAVIIVGSWLVVFPRNKEWKSNITLYTVTLERNPDAHILRRELGEVYFLEGEPEKAREAWEYLIAKASDWKDITMAYKGMGDYYRLNNEPDLALDHYVKGAETGGSPRDFVTFNSAGVLFMDKGEILKGFSYFCQSAQLLPDSDNPAQGYVNTALAMVEEQFIEPGTLHDEVLASFVASPIQRIQYLDTRCDDEACQHALGYNADIQEILLPVLITAVDSKDREIEITNKSYDPEQSVIVLEIDAAYENEEIEFLFPLCRREYYKATTN